MKKIFIALFLVLLFSLQARMEILQQTTEKIILKLEIDNIQIKENDQFTDVYIEGWDYPTERKTPALPMKTINIGVPPQGEISIRVLSIETTTNDLNKPVRPVATIREADKTHDFIYEIDQKKYVQSINEHFNKKQLSSFRRFSYVPVDINPVIYYHNRSKLEVCSEIVLEIYLMGNTGYRDFKPDKIENIYSDFLLNYEQARFWRTNYTAEIEKIPFEKSDFWYRIETAQNGLYKISDKNLELLPDFADLNDLQLFTMYREVMDEKTLDYDFRLQEIPLYVDENKVYFSKMGLDDERLDKAQPNIYWLTFGLSNDTEPARLNQFFDKTVATEIITIERKIINNSRGSRTDFDGVIIYPETGVFELQSQQYADLHSEYSMELKSQADIFDEYSSGSPDQYAIRNYLADLYAANPNLAYLILMGSGTQNWTATDAKNKIITFTESFGESYDDGFSIFPGSPVINRPALATGRIPAQNDNELDFYIDRITTYIQEPTSGFWRNKVLIMADDEHKKGGFEGQTIGLNHTKLAQQTDDLLNEEIYVEKIMGVQYGFDVFKNKPDARNAMIDKINDGCLIWYYIGHGNDDVMGDEDYFRGSQHMYLLQNEDKLPLMLAASCNVGEFDKLAFDCIGENLLFHEDGGSIASIAASASCDGSGNTILMKSYLQRSLNDTIYHTAGSSLLYAKLNSSATYGNSQKYNLLGDPLLQINTPHTIGSITNPPDSIRALETVTFEGNFGNGNLYNGSAEIRVLEPEYNIIYSNPDFIVSNDTIFYTVEYTQEGNSLFTGINDLTSGEYSVQFIVSEDIHSGNTGQVINYHFNEIDDRDYLSAFYPLICSTIPVDVTSTGSPQVELFLESKSFLPGDEVSTTPLLIAEMEDENGINIVGAAGHKILLLIDDSTEPIDITTGFIYDPGSYTKGDLSWQLDELGEGYHSLQLIVFDNLNNATVAETYFTAKKQGKVSISKLLPYPNPIENDGYFTFVITEDADITISIYTISGRKIRSLDTTGCNAGYNQIYWDGRDGDGDKIANNTYFYKIKAKQIENGKVTEKIGKVIILR